MQPVDDAALLRQYVENGSDDAFAALVTEHVSLVYSVAMRWVGNPHHAEEITQAIFIILAKKAPQLRNHRALSSWLFQTTRLTAKNFLRSEMRRQRREQEAYMQSTVNEANDEAWRRIAPLLDAAVEALGEKDRRAVLLRFYEGRNFRDVSYALGTTEAATEKRVSRAVEKLRAYFGKRGVTISAVAIAAAVSANSAKAAPVGLAKTISIVAAAQGVTASASTLTLIQGALKAMAWTKAKTAIIAGITMMLVAGAVTVTVREINAPHHEVWQEKFDLSVLEKVPPHVRILPSLPATIQTGLHAASGRSGKALGLGQEIPDLLTMAYGVRPTQLVLTFAMPKGKYDFIANLPGDNREALQQEIKRKFGLIGRRVIMATNVLVLTVQSRGAAGLKPASGPRSGSQGRNYYSAYGQSLSPLVDYLERFLDAVVVDETGLNGAFDIDFKYDSTPEGLEKVLLDDLGLKLSTNRQNVEFVAVEKVN